MALPAQAPVELSKYELLEEIGHGGMATVYRAKDRRLGREVAVKVIHRHLRESPEVAQRFHSEALAVAKVKHPNIVEVYDVSGEEDDEKYLVVELIRGVTLRQWLRERGPLPPEIAACIAVEMTRALTIAHRAGIVHRDIKPENVLLRLGASEAESGGSDAARVKLTDFGIAKLLDAQGVTHTGQVLGSPAHMAPEQIEGGDVDARSDVFGAGVLLYEMLTGCLPFEGKNPAQVLRKVLEGTFLPAERQLPVVGAAYGAITQRALSRDPADRFASASEMGEALSAELLTLGVDDVRREISAYLCKPDEYLKKHVQRLPELLSEAATKARAERHMARAASLFNRALAYRPDDTRLLAEVAGLARRDRMRRRLAAGMGAALSIALLAAGCVGVYRLLKSQPAPFHKQASEQAQNVRPKAKSVEKPSSAQQPAVETPAPPVKEEPAAELTEPPSKPSRAPALARPALVVPIGKRSVRTPVVGPQNARVRIDGVLKAWYESHNLDLGPHTFEFVPPNSECCEASPPQTVDVVAGEGDQVVRGIIRFRPATLRLQGPDGSRASCGIGDVIVAGSSRDIPMNRPSRQLSCTVFPPPNAPGEPQTVAVNLSPGRTFTLTSN